MQGHEKGAKGGGGKFARSRVPTRIGWWRLVAGGWSMQGQLGWHAVPTLPKEEGQRVVLSLPEAES